MSAKWSFVPRRDCVRRDFQDARGLGGIVHCHSLVQRPGESLQTVDAQALPPEAYLGVAGLPGLTAYVGLLDMIKIGKMLVKLA